VKSGKDTFTKVKGVNLNFANVKLLNADVMEDFVRRPSPENVVTIPEPKKIVRDLKCGVLRSVDRKKDYRITYTKRVIKDNHNTHPFGYIVEATPAV